MGYTDLLNRPNVYISYDGNDTAAIDNTGGGSYQLTRTPSGATATFATDNPKSQFSSCLVTQVPNMESWTGSGTPADLNVTTNERFNEQQVANGRGWEFWVKIDSSVALTNDIILLEWVDGTEITRVNLTTDRKIMLTGSLTYTTFQGIGQNATIYSDVLSLDEWHLVSITSKLLYTPPGFNDSSFEYRACSFLMVDGKIYRHTATQNDTQIKSITMPTKLFSEISIPGIKFAHFAFWQTGINHKLHVRRYMYGKAKTQQSTLILNSNPWAFSFMNYDSVNNQYGLGGTYVNPGEPQSAIIPTTESISNGAIDLNYHGGIEGTRCIRMTKYQNDPTLITNAGSLLVGTQPTQYNFHKLYQDNILNTGNYTIEFWYKNGFTQRDYDSTAAGVSPLLIAINNFSVVQNIRLTTSGEWEYVIKLNNTSSSQSTGITGSQWSMRELGKRIDNEWHHIAIVSTYNNPVLNIKTYVDGTLYNNYQNNNCQVLNSSYQVNPSDPNNHAIGFFFGAAQQYQTNGHLDNFAVHATQLTEEQIRSRYLNYNIVERPHFMGAKLRRSFAQGYVESIKYVWQPADNVLYYDSIGNTFVRNENEIKFWDGTNWVSIG